MTKVTTKGMTKKDFIQTIKTFANADNHGDIMVLAVMSHGRENHAGVKLLTSNYEELDMEFDIIK